MYYQTSSLLKSENYLNNILKIPNSFFEKKYHFAIISIEIGTDTRNFVKKVMEYANKNKTKEIFDNEIFQEINLENENLIKYFLEKSNELNLNIRI